MSSNKRKYDNAYGIWTVTTEGDVEGRTTNHLGTFEGYLDEIAFKLAGKSYYGLRFAPADDLALISRPGTKVQVSLDIDSGTWDMKGEQRVNFFKKLLAGRKVSVAPGQYYACVELIDGDSPEEIARREKELKKQKALAKLSAEDRELLGLVEGLGFDISGEKS